MMVLVPCKRNQPTLETLSSKPQLTCGNGSVPSGTPSDYFLDLPFLLAQGLDFVFQEPLILSAEQNLDIFLVNAPLGSVNWIWTLDFEEEGGSLNA